MRLEEAPIIRRVMRCALVAGTVAAGAMLIGAERVPPLPIAPNTHQTEPPFLMRITTSGAPKMTGVLEYCADPAAALMSARARAKARPAGAPPPMAGCTSAFEMRPNGSIHTQMSCDRAKGAKASFRVTGDGTPNDRRTHMELYESGSRTPTAIVDSRMVRLGTCPADLKPGQMRRPGGPIIERAEAARLLDGARVAAR
jgi:hypothetical protein